MNILFFDTETNGLENCSVLSASAIMAVYPKFEIVGKVNRFYYAEEEYNLQAWGVHGLDEETITKKRMGFSENEIKEYARHFRRDDQFSRVVRWADLIVGHRISFDLSFLPWVHTSHSFCTMHSNARIVQKRFMKDSWRWPKLVETAEHYGIEVDDEKLHGSWYDTVLVFLVFKAMVAARNPQALMAVGDRVSHEDYVREAGAYRIMMGKKLKGKCLQEIDDDILQWCADTWLYEPNSAFAADVKVAIEKYLRLKRGDQRCPLTVRPQIIESEA